HLPLNRLDQAGVGQLLAEMWGQEIPEEWTAAIYQRTGGNPFYVEEVAKDLVDEGSVSLQDGAWHFASLGDVKLPQRARDIILRRTGRLSPAAQEVLRLAAVLGQQFTFEDLLAVSSQPEEQLLETLDTLLEREMIRESDGGTMLAFNHVEIQEVVYEELNTLRQRVLHRRVAAGLEKARAHNLGPATSQLAYHFTKAGDREKAFYYSLQAAQQAQVLHAYQTALDWYSQAANLRPEGDVPPASLIALYNGLGEMLHLQSHYAEAAEAYRKALALAAQTQDKLAEVESWNGLALVQDKQGDYRGAWESGIRAAEISRQLGPAGQAELARALTRQGWAMFRLGNPEKALELGGQALQLSQAVGPAGRYQLGLSLNLLGSVYNSLGRHVTARDHLEQALALYQEVGDRDRASSLLNNLGGIAMSRGDYQAACELFREALTIRREMGNRHGEMLSLSNLGGAKVGLGHYEAAEAALRQVIAFFTEGSDRPMYLPETYSFLAMACLRQGKVKEALAAAVEALRLGHEMERLGHVALAWRSLGQVAEADFGLADEESKIQNLDERFAFASKIDSPSACFAESVRLFTQIGAEGERARSLRAWADYEKRAGDAVKGEAMWQEAREIFERLEITLELEVMGRGYEGG
ncbi:MAG: tetratricopeptide repeat protein, partial [Chloroflexi bacterium]|nr:tetratricopeptide repeat protein [Chloroflexota bacterium]